MEKSKIIKAKEEAQRFIKKVDELLKRYKDAPYYELSYTKESGAVRRASMDLTRILAEMRSNK